jgi:hypothetical protein
VEGFLGGGSAERANLARRSPAGDATSSSLGDANGESSGIASSDGAADGLIVRFFPMVSASNNDAFVIGFLNAKDI